MSHRFSKDALGGDRNEARRIGVLQLVLQEGHRLAAIGFAGRYLDAPSVMVEARPPDVAAQAKAAGMPRGLDVTAVVERTGMSKDWLYREVRAGRLPFARRLGRRVVFDQAGLERWLERRSGQRRAGDLLRYSS